MAIAPSSWITNPVPTGSPSRLRILTALEQKRVLVLARSQSSSRSPLNLSVHEEDCQMRSAQLFSHHIPKVTSPSVRQPGPSSQVYANETGRVRDRQNPQVIHTRTRFQEVTRCSRFSSYRMPSKRESAGGQRASKEGTRQRLDIKWRSLAEAAACCSHKCGAFGAYATAPSRCACRQPPPYRMCLESCSPAGGCHGNPGFVPRTVTDRALLDDRSPA